LVQNNDVYIYLFVKDSVLQLGMTGNYIWYYGTPHERISAEMEFNRIMKENHYEFLKDGGKIQYSHKV